MAVIHKIIAQNLDRLMRHAEEEGRLELATPVAIEQTTKGKVTKSTIYRIVNEEVSARVDNLADLADAFQIPAWALLYDGLVPGTKILAVTEDGLEVLIQHRAADLVQATLSQLIANHDRDPDRQAPDPSTNSRLPDKSETGSPDPSSTDDDGA